MTDLQSRQRKTWLGKVYLELYKETRDTKQKTSYQCKASPVRIFFGARGNVYDDGSLIKKSDQLFRNTTARKPFMSFQKFGTDENEKRIVLSIGHLDAFMTTAADSLITMLNKLNRNVTLLSTGINSKRQKSCKGGRMPIDSVLRFQKFLPDAITLLLQDKMNTFQKNSVSSENR